MFKVTRLVHLADGPGTAGPLSGRIRTALTGAARVLVAPTLPGSRNGGDILVHAQFATEQSWADSEPALDAALADTAVSRVDGVDYRSGSAPQAPRCTSSVYRTLLIAVDPATPAAVVADFEADLLLMPRYVDTIAAFQLSRPRRAVGVSRWTHVFEQEFTDEKGLMGPYLMHPIHWARVDRWFDPECPEHIVRERVCHSFCSSPTSLLA